MSGAGAGGRRGARERALSLLYEAEAKDESMDSVLGALPVPPDGFTVAIVTGVDAQRNELDELIRRFARGWRLERMPMLDRTVLRMATFELLHRADVPTAAVISEAVELAKRFSTDKSGRFVNGVLSSIAAEVRPGSTSALAPEQLGELDLLDAPDLDDLDDLADLCLL